MGFSAKNNLYWQKNKYQLYLNNIQHSRLRYKIITLISGINIYEYNKLRYVNIAVGLTQIILNLIFIVPLTILIIKSKGGGFGFGLLVLPLSIPLNACILFGLISLKHFANFQTKLTLYIISHYLTAIVGIISFALLPILPTILIGLPYSMIALTSLNPNNLNKQILITNSLVLLSIVALIGIKLLR